MNKINKKKHYNEAVLDLTFHVEGFKANLLAFRTLVVVQ